MKLPTALGAALIATTLALAAPLASADPAPSTATAAPSTATAAPSNDSVAKTEVALAPRFIAADARIDDYRLAPERRASAEQASHVYKLMYVVRLVWLVALLLVVLRLRLAARVFAFAERVTRRRWLQLIVFALAFAPILELAMMPVVIAGQLLDRHYGLSVQGWGSFARDGVVSLVLETLLSAPIIWVIYWVLRRSPRRWWLWTWLVTLPFLLFVDFVRPTWIDPLYYRYTPLAQTQPALVSSLRQIAAGRGVDIPPERIFEMNASSKLRTVNAFVKGYGASTRIIVWDTSLQAMNQREIAALFGHELGHYVERHLFIGELEGVGWGLLSLFLTASIVAWVIRRRGAKLAIEGIESPASLPLIMLVGMLLSYASTPTGNGLWRYLEHRADAFGLKAIDGHVDDAPQAAAHMLQRLGEIDLAQPDPGALDVFWFYNHPPIRDRIRFVLGR